MEVSCKAASWGGTGVSVYSIKFLMSYIRRNGFKLFGYYRIVLGILVILYFGIKALAAFWG